jgi:CBS domain-containing protein
VNTQAVGAPVEGLLASAIAFLRRYPPFDEMEAGELRALAAKLVLGYYAKGSVILAPESGEPAYLYIVQRGLVHVVPPAGDVRSDAGLIVLRPGETFSVGGLLERRPVRTPYVAAEDTFCYQVPAATFREVLQNSPRLQNFATRYLTSLLRESRRLLGFEHSRHMAEQQAMSRSLRSLVKRRPVACTPDTPIGAALAMMSEAKVGSILVQGSNGRLEGIFTRHDVLDRVALAKTDLALPISSVMTLQPRTLSADATAYEAALLIANHGIRHVPITENEHPIGVVTERDLFALQRTSLRAINRTISEAASIEALVDSARDIRKATSIMLGQGMAPEQLTYLVSTLNDALTRRVLELQRLEHGLGNNDWCWLAFGSEGRYEQTLATDQDNGIIFAAPRGETAASMRERLLPFARAANIVLDACGFPLCKGEIMAGNPAWCLSADEWLARYNGWIQNTQPEALLEAVVVFDFRPLFGRHDLAESLRSELLALTARNGRFLKQLAQYALETRPPLGVFSDFQTQDVPGAPRTIDLKLSGARLFVDLARVWSLATETPHTNTAERLRQAGPKLNIPPAEIAAAVDAFFFIQGLRLRAQVDADKLGRKGQHNRIDPDQLNEIDRRILKESFRQVRKLQARQALDYQL